jgi:hypothetical protein
MALDPIVTGATWRAVITAEPTSGQSNSDVSTVLDGASVSARILNPDGTAAVTCTAAVLLHQQRTVTISMTAVQTATLTPNAVYAWDVKVTSTTPETFPLAIPGRPVVKATATP